MITLLVSAALAAPTGYKVTVAEHDGCELSLGPADADGDLPMRAECRWADVTIEAFDRWLADWGAHAVVFESIVESKTQRSEAGRDLVYQKHQAGGISDREVLLWMWHETADGYSRYAWSTATAEALTVTQGNVRCAKSEGYWQAKADAAGGITLVHELRYAPGGSVPGFLVRWFQTGGLQASVDDMHAALKK